MVSQPGVGDHADDAISSEIVSGSRIISAGQTLSGWVDSVIKDSYCYHWLNKEPEPKVIVIDLRKTYVVGSFIALLDWLLPQVVHAWQHSRVGSVAKRAYEQLQEEVLDPLSETRGYELAVAIFEPPEPPEQQRKASDSSASDEGEQF